MVKIPHENIEHVCIGNKEFVFVTKNKFGKQELYHGIVDEKYEDEDLEGYGEFQQLVPNNN